MACAVNAAEEEVIWTLSSGDAAEGGNYLTRLSLSFTLTDSATSYTATPNVEGALFDTSHYLQTITITKCGQGVNKISGILTNASGVVIGAVDAGSTTANSSVIFNFSEQNITLSKDETYMLYFKKNATDLTSLVTIGATLDTSIFVTNKTGQQAWQNDTFIVYTAANATGDGMMKYGTNDGNQYVPAMSITTKTVPEPATATLSLLALAGLAARRRRR